MPNLYLLPNPCQHRDYNKNDFCSYYNVKKLELFLG